MTKGHQLLGVKIECTPQRKSWLRLCSTSSSGRGTGLWRRNCQQSSCQHPRTANYLCFRTARQHPAREPTVIEF